MAQITVMLTNGELKIASTSIEVRDMGQQTTNRKSGSGFRTKLFYVLEDTSAAA
jgi:hypothetical protein